MEVQAFAAMTVLGAHAAMERANATPVPADAPASGHADVILEAQALAGSS